jgi:hypothetical protein
MMIGGDGNLLVTVAGGPVCGTVCFGFLSKPKPFSCNRFYLIFVLNNIIDSAIHLLSIYITPSLSN